MIMGEIGLRSLTKERAPCISNVALKGPTLIV